MGFNGEMTEAMCDLCNDLGVDTAEPHMAYLEVLLIAKSLAMVILGEELPEVMLSKVDLILAAKYGPDPENEEMAALIEKYGGL